MLISDIPALVERLIPGLLRPERASVVCIRTTNTKYLVFEGDATRPVCALGFGAPEALRRVDGVMTELNRQFSASIPRPLLCAPFHDGVDVQIQEGVRGVPWFRMDDQLGTQQAWRMLLGRAVEAMVGLHEATRTVSDWTATVDPAAEIQRQVTRCDETGTTLS